MKVYPAIQKYKFPVCLALAVILLFAPAASAEQTVAVLPFTINSEKDLGYLQEGIMSMLASRLTWEDKVRVIAKADSRKAFQAAGGKIDETSARSIGTTLAADHVLFGSLTVFGDSVSLDARMVDISGDRETLSFFNQSQGMDEVIPRVNVFAEEINEKVFGRQSASRPPTRVQAVAPAPTATPETQMHPEKRLAAGGYGEGASPIQIFGKMGAGSGFWKSRNFPFVIRGLAMGDVDGDGKTETVMISDAQLHIYRAEEGAFNRIQEINIRNVQLVSVDVADINGNGKAEIFLTTATKTSLEHDKLSVSAYVYEWDGGAFQEIRKDYNRYYRVIREADIGNVLVSQQQSTRDMFRPGVDKLMWNNGEYVPSGDRYVLPGDFNLYMFAPGDILNNGTRYTVALNQRDKLLVFSPAGQAEWESQDYYGGCENYLEFGRQGNFNSSYEKGNIENRIRIYLQQRIFITDLDHDGDYEVVVARNRSSMGRFMAKMKDYSGFQFAALSWNGLGLIKDWQTRRMAGYVADWGIADFDNDGQLEIAAGVRTSKGGMPGQTAKSTVVVFDLDRVIAQGVDETIDPDLLEGEDNQE